MTANELLKSQKAIGVPAELICGEAGVSLRTWQRIIAGDVVAEKKTLNALRVTIDRLLLDAIHKDER